MSRPRPRVELYDLVMDPAEMRNLADDDHWSDLRQELDQQLSDWMRDTDDPLLGGPVLPPPGAVVNDPAGISAREPYLHAVD